MCSRDRVNVPCLGEGRSCPTQGWPLVEINCEEECLQLVLKLSTSSESHEILRNIIILMIMHVLFILETRYSVVYKLMVNNSIHMITNVNK